MLGSMARWSPSVAGLTRRFSADRLRPNLPWASDIRGELFHKGRELQRKRWFCRSTLPCAVRASNLLGA